jgi:hypothetical protein
MSQEGMRAFSTEFKNAVVLRLEAGERIAAVGDETRIGRRSSPSSSARSASKQMDLDFSHEALRLIDARDRSSRVMPSHDENHLDVNWTPLVGPRGIGFKV